LSPYSQGIIRTLARIGNGTSEVVGPFEAAKKRFFKGTVIPICTGWFGEVNKDYDSLISTLAQWYADLPFGQLG
jgi:hypothetical protein